MRLRKQQLVGLVWVWGPRRSWLGNRTWQSSHGKVSNKHTRLNSLWTLEQHTIRLWNDKPDCECLNVCKYVSGLGVLLLLTVVPRSPLESHINSTLFCLCRSSIVEAVPQWPCLDLGACSPEHGAWSIPCWGRNTFVTCVAEVSPSLGFFNPTICASDWSVRVRLLIALLWYQINMLPHWFPPEIRMELKDQETTLVWSPCIPIQRPFHWPSFLAQSFL